jgi:putative endonuclease
MTNRRKTGNAGEEAAAEYLIRNGFTILERNYVFNHGEIDIVAREGEELVFVEVKLRRSAAFGSAVEGVTPRKQELVRRTAEGYVYERNLTDVSCRFDVVAMDGEKGRIEILHLRNAF